ncbi:hypothetical protein [Bradyrhizobium sp. BWC-3-1]|uniref:hypothetical protein n=1 Tax=Bradyrhizobium sp. BWC-3-1 TaxID=3080012 RepID=UPI00293E95B8|nr:hypothetical protein [Bradyrhizobium sp. BWC-3-1]WOH61940.1 hypothetical protein RX329_18335 [Bradyrhizobium sp. BWC-3-1]
MIATMDTCGVITLKAETSLEGYALRKWMEQAGIQTNDMLRREQLHWRGSMLMADGNPPDEVKA